MCGIKPWEFWDITPAELNLIIEVYSEKEIEKHKSNITYAFYSAYFHLKGQKGLSGKDLNDILDKIGKQKEMSDEDLYKKIIAINASLGGEVN